MKKIIASGATALLLAGGLIALSGAAASATDADVCTPAEAYTETIEHPAEGEATIVIDNPDYVAPTYTPGYTEHVDAVGTPTIEVDNPDYVEAVPEKTEVVHHEAITHVEYHFSKFTREKTRTWSASYGWSEWTEYGEWSQWAPDAHASWEFSADPIGTPQFHSKGIRDWGTLQWERQWQVRHDGDTRTVEDIAAWDETIVTPGTPAVGEPTIIIDNPDYVAEHDVWIDPVYTPAVGEPTIEVDNPDYVAAYTETIEHEAVECETTPAPVEEKPKPAAQAADADDDTEDPETLAVTGGSVDMGLLAGAGALLLAGGVLFGVRRLSRR